MWKGLCAENYKTLLKKLKNIQINGELNFIHGLEDSALSRLILFLDWSTDLTISIKILVGFL